jgi:hypothetical protein
LIWVEWERKYFCKRDSTARINRQTVRPAGQQGSREAGNGAVHIELVDLDRFLELWLPRYQRRPVVMGPCFRRGDVDFTAPEKP